MTTVIHPTYTGKGYIAFKLIEEHSGAVIFCLCRSVSISPKRRQKLNW